MREVPAAEPPLIPDTPDVHTYLPFSVGGPDKKSYARDLTKIGRCHHWRRWRPSIGQGGNKHQGPKGLLAIDRAPLG